MGYMGMRMKERKMGRGTETNYFERMAENQLRMRLNLQTMAVIPAVIQAVIQAIAIFHNRSFV